MSRLVAVSNRISVPKRGAAPGGLAVGLHAAMQARRGMWFGWDGETSEAARHGTTLRHGDPVRYCDESAHTISSQLRDRRSALPMTPTML